MTDDRHGWTHAQCDGCWDRANPDGRGMKYHIILQVDAAEGADENWEEGDAELFYESLEEGLCSVDMQNAISICLEDWYATSAVEVEIQDVVPALPKWRVQVELNGVPAKFYVEAEDKDAAKMKVQNQLGPADFVFTRTYEMPWWSRLP